MAPAIPHDSIVTFRKRQLSFPAVESASRLDFRHLFKSNQAMERTTPSPSSSSIIKKCVSSIRKLSSISPQNPASEWQPQSSLPNEILARIFTNLHGADLRNARAVSRKWLQVIDNTKYVTDTLTSRVISRFVVRAVGKGAVEFRWCIYGSGQSKSVVFNSQQLRNIHSHSLLFSFRQFQIQRIIFKNVTLTNDLLSFFTRHFAVSSNFSPISLVFEGVDVSQLSPVVFEQFFAEIAPHLEILQLRSLSGLRADIINDRLMNRLDVSKIKSIEISSPKFGFAHRPKIVRVSDLTLARFSAEGNFPALHLERCQITSLMLAHYTENYLKKAAAEKRMSVQCQHCTIKKCPAVSDKVYRSECRRRSLSCEEDDKKHHLYSVHNDENTDAAFTISLIDDEIPQLPAAPPTATIPSPH